MYQLGLEPKILARKPRRLVFWSSALVGIGNCTAESEGAEGEAEEAAAEAEADEGPTEEGAADRCGFKTLPRRTCTSSMISFMSPFFRVANTFSTRFSSFFFFSACAESQNVNKAKAR